jgi:hypothetical protein
MRFMTWFDGLYWSNHFWTAIAVFSAILVLLSTLADRRRHKRRDINNVGFVPWTAITVLSVLSTVLAAALAIKGA